jgi:hypothetical protein
MNTCLIKYFGIPAITRNEAANVLKNLVCATLDEIRRMDEAGEFPACMRLFIRAILYDLETGRTDTLNHPEFRVLTVKLLENCYADTVCKR